MHDIRAKLNEILYQQEQYTNPLERAVYIHCNIAKLQPFIDGNKRTSRMMESIALMNADIIPVYSSKGCRYTELQERADWLLWKQEIILRMPITS